jgi:hypothetical protein
MFPASIFAKRESRLNGPTQATGEGTHFLVPWLQRAILYDCRIKPRVSSFWLEAIRTVFNIENRT